MRFTRYLLPAASLAVLVLAFVVVPDVLAQFGLDTAAKGAGIPTGDITSIIGRILKTLLGFVGTIFLLLMVYAGFLYMTAHGDSKKVDSAKQMIVGAIIGIVIIASAYAITSFVLGAATNGASSGAGTGAGVGSGNKCQPMVCTTYQECTAPRSPTDTCINSRDCRCPSGLLGTLQNPCPPSAGECLTKKK